MNGERVNSLYRPYSQSNPSQSILRLLPGLEIPGGLEIGRNFALVNSRVLIVHVDICAW